MHGALVAFGVHMQSNRLGDLRAEVAGEPFFAETFMAAVDALFSDVLGHSVKQMANVVQKRRSYQRIGGLILFSQLCGLKRMLKFRDPFAIGQVAIFLK